MTFLDTWFPGFCAGLDGLDPAARSALLRPCALVCSESYPVRIVRAAATTATNPAEFWRALEARMDDVHVEEEAEHSAVLTFSRCGCDLVSAGYVTTLSLCECSRLSVTHTLEAVFGSGSVEVSLLETILGGAERCRLLVEFSEEQGPTLAR